MKCPNCGGRLLFEIGYIHHESGFAAVHSEDRVYCINCAHHRYLTELADTPEPKARPSGLPLWVLEAVAPRRALKRARRIMRNVAKREREQDSKEAAENQILRDEFEAGLDEQGYSFSPEQGWARQ